MNAVQVEFLKEALVFNATYEIKNGIVLNVFDGARLRDENEFFIPHEAL